MMKKIILFLTVMTLGFVAFSKAHPNEKLLINKWKMIKTLKNGAEIDPTHDKLTIEFLKKNKQYVVTAQLEETHKGSWSLSADGKKITLVDTDTKKEKTIDILKIDKLHLNISHFDGESDEVVIETIPLGKGKAIHLTHKEHLIAKAWHVYESDKETNIGLLMEFKVDKTFIMLPNGSKVPVASGKWHLSDDNGKIIMDMKEAGRTMELTIVELHTHDLILKQEESGVTNKFHDRRIENQKEKAAK
jgi:hypothetical protein